ncbi:MAG: Rho termination factor N-terminal domain-containing protein [Solirubrobacteraceae bacterium]|nr:Rho termination factor N-terminal domain-containing protein [Solirubrobacteraceae bacterium]
MSAVLTREVLESSPLADLHALAGELAIDGFRRLRRDDLIGTILDRRGDADASEGSSRGGRRRRRGGSATDEASGTRGDARDRSADARGGDDQGNGRRRRRRGGSDGDDRPSTDGGRSGDDRPTVQDGETVTGAVTIGDNGSGTLATDDGVEVFLSAGQVRRCELTDGDRVSGPVRPPRRSERFPSLVRVETVNGEPADARSSGPRDDDQRAVHPHELLVPSGDDPTVLAIGWLTPIGRGSRAVIAGPSGAGKTEALRRLGVALRDNEQVEVVTVLAGTRPEETGDWVDAGLEPTATVDLGASPDHRTKAIDEAVERGRRTAAGGGHAVLLVDSLDGLGEGAARRILSAARRLASGGSLTIIATRDAPVGGESTVVTLDRSFTITGRFPAIDLPASGTMRPELLVGEEGAAAIAAARADLAG